LTVVLKPQPGLRSIQNPVAVGGGADADAPFAVRKLAPRSVLTFGRAVSVDDFQTIAAQAPGVTRAKAAIAFDATAQRGRVTVWVGDDAAAVLSAQQAFAASADPFRQPRVVLAQAALMNLSLTIVYSAKHDGPTLKAAVRAALIDAGSGLLGLNAVGIGEVFYDSQVYAACLAVPGVVAVHSLNFAVTTVRFLPIYTKFRGIDLLRLTEPGNRVSPLPKKVPLAAQPPEREPVVVVPAKREPVVAAPKGCLGQRHDPGADSYLFLPDDDEHLTIALEVAS
jgi:hypothetical protein